MVKVKQGSEREACVSLMNKMMALKGTKDQLYILSASVFDKIPSVIYVEAHKELHVWSAIKGM